jgi:hypothetical protein
MCRSYQNCASRRDSQGCGCQAAHRGSAQLMMVFPFAVAFSTGLCARTRRGRAVASLVACTSPTLPARAGAGPEARRRAASGDNG